MFLLSTWSAPQTDIKQPIPEVALHMEFCRSAERKNVSSAFPCHPSSNEVPVKTIDFRYNVLDTTPELLLDVPVRIDDAVLPVFNVLTA